MKNKLLNIVTVLAILTAMLSCKKTKDEPKTAQFQSLTFKFGTDSTAISVDNAAQTLKNLPRNSDVTKLVARVVLPSGYSISPDPSTAKDYTKGVTYTVTTNEARTYTVQITAPAYDAVSNPYGIYTARHLSDVRFGLNDSYVLMNDIQLPDLSAAAATNLGISDYRDHGWYSIGSSYVDGGAVVFRGMLDGQGHVVKNLTMINRPDGTLPPANIDAGHNGKNTDGLFGNAIKATFKNIGIQLASTGINDWQTDGSGYGSVGSLIGQADSCTITNCYVAGTSLIKGKQYTGGLIGKALNSTISKCYAAISPAAGNYAITAPGDGGGLIGWALYTTVTDSYASCGVVGSVNVGGLIGYANTCTIKTSYASGNVSEIPYNETGGLVAPNSLGGLIGAVNTITPATSIIQNCYATGAVAGANGSNTGFHQGTRVGGLIGQVTSNSGPVSVMYCYASGPVSRVWTSATAPYLIGALVGTTPNNVFITSSVCTNYWDKTTTGQANLGGGNGAFAQDNAFTANGKTTAEMKTQGTFLNWDFSTVWTLAAGTNSGYPYLRSINK